MSIACAHRPRPLALTIAASVAAALALVGPAPASADSACDSANASLSRTTERKVVRATLCLVNAERMRLELPPLRLDRRLSRAADRHAGDMVRRRYFSHTSLDGSSFLDRIRDTGYLRNARAWSAGENIAWGSGSRSTPRAIARAWIQSPGHRANILSADFHDIGIGVETGAPVNGVSGRAGTYTTDFGARG